MTRGPLFGHVGWGCNSPPTQDRDPREGDQKVLPKRRDRWGRCCRFSGLSRVTRPFCWWTR